MDNVKIEPMGANEDYRNAMAKLSKTLTNYIAKKKPSDALVTLMYKDAFISSNYNALVKILKDKKLIDENEYVKYMTEAIREQADLIGMSIGEITTEDGNTIILPNK